MSLGYWVVLPLVVITVLYSFCIIMFIALFMFSMALVYLRVPAYRSSCGGFNDDTQSDQKVSVHLTITVFEQSPHN
jgi:cytochrome c oxidase assembly protein Cox11